MKPKSKWRGSFFLVPIVAVSLALFVAVYADEELEVEIGAAAPSVGDHSHPHDITVDSLKQGKMEYLLKGGSEGSHRVVLTKRQVADLLNGTTAIIQSEKSQDSGKIKSHQHRVTITVKTRERERSGW
jgi:hypothetical protein